MIIPLSKITFRPSLLFGLLLSIGYGVWLWYLVMTSRQTLPPDFDIRDAMTPLLLLYVLGTGIAFMANPGKSPWAKGFLIGQLLMLMGQGLIFGSTLFISLFVQ